MACFAQWYQGMVVEPTWRWRGATGTTLQGCLGDVVTFMVMDDDDDDDDGCFNELYYFILLLQKI